MVIAFENDCCPRSSPCDQVVPGPSPCPASPGFLLPSEKRETLVPFVGLNNLGNTCYLNSVLQVGWQVVFRHLLKQSLWLSCYFFFEIVTND